MNHKFLIRILLPCLLPLGVVAQNLVHNPSFEEIDDCPLKLGQIKQARFWNVGTKQSKVDLYHYCARDKSELTATPANYHGSMPPNTGRGYAGLMALRFRKDSAATQERHYLQGRLKSPMTQGAQYCVRMKVSSAHNLDLKKLGVKFSATTFGSDADSLIEPKFTSLKHANNDVIDAYKEWAEISGSYTAKGGEEYFNIGFFQHIKTGNEFISSFDSIGSERMAYYFIDDVCVVPLDVTWTCECGSFERKPLKNVVIRFETQLAQPLKDSIPSILDEIFFELDKAALLPVSYAQLNEWTELLKKYPNTNIEIQGHTDNSGTAQRNQTLSLDRAIAVQQYFVNHGIKPERIRSVGYGTQYPIAPNDSESGRSKNRRVAVKVLK